jgi:hypothetical protein
MEVAAGLGWPPARGCGTPPERGLEHGAIAFPSVKIFTGLQIERLLDCKLGSVFTVK